VFHNEGVGETPQALPKSLGKHTPKSNHGPPGWRLGMKLTSFLNNDNAEKPKERCRNDCRKTGVKTRRA
jgi:hypothetical protein